MKYWLIVSGEYVAYGDKSDLIKLQKDGETLSKYWIKREYAVEDLEASKVNLLAQLAELAVIERGLDDKTGGFYIAKKEAVLEKKKIF
jgi:hypothetical protein